MVKKNQWTHWKAVSKDELLRNRITMYGGQYHYDHSIVVRHKIFGMQV